MTDQQGGGRVFRSAGGTNPRDPRHRRNAQGQATDYEFGAGLGLDSQGRVQVKVSQRSPFDYDQQGELYLRVGDGLQVTPGSPYALRLKPADSSVETLPAGLRSRPTLSQVRNDSREVRGSTLRQVFDSEVELLKRKGEADGYCPLDARGVIPTGRGGVASSVAQLDGAVQVPGAQLGGASFGGAGTKVLRDSTPPDWGAVPAAALPAHASTHQHGGSDEVATATPAANAIPKADGSNKLAAGWISEVLAPTDLTGIASVTGSGTALVLGTAPTISNAVLSFPFIGDFSNANHAHTNSATGGTLDAAAIASGTVAVARLPAATTSAAGISELATSAETTAGLVVQASDTRLSDTRQVPRGTSFPTAAEGDLYYRTDLDELFFYEGTRSKWLSVRTFEYEFNESVGVVSGTYLRFPGGPITSATLGYVAAYDLTCVGISYYNADGINLVLRLRDDGSNAVSVTTTAGVGGNDMTINVDFASGSVISAITSTTSGAGAGIRGIFRRKAT